MVADHSAPLDTLVRVIGQAFPQAMLHFASAPVSARLMLSRLEPDWVVLDLDMRGMDGDWRRFIDEAQALDAKAHLVVAAPRANDERILPALRAGAAAYLVKGAPPSFLAQRLRSIASGVLPLDGALAAQIARHLECECGNELPEREEWEILNWVTAGDTLEQAAARLGMAPQAAERDINRLYARLNLKLVCAAPAPAGDS